MKKSAVAIPPLCAFAGIGEIDQVLSQQHRMQELQSQVRAEPMVVLELGTPYG